MKQLEQACKNVRFKRRKLKFVIKELLPAINKEIDEGYYLLDIHQIIKTKVKNLKYRHFCRLMEELHGEKPHTRQLAPVSTVSNSSSHDEQPMHHVTKPDETILKTNVIHNQESHFCVYELCGQDWMESTNNNSVDAPTQDFGDLKYFVHPNDDVPNKKCSELNLYSYKNILNERAKSAEGRKDVAICIERMKVTERAERQLAELDDRLNKQEAQKEAFGLHFDKEEEREKQVQLIMRRKEIALQELQ